MITKDIFNAKYTYDDIKIACCIVDYIKNYKHKGYPDFEDLAVLTLTIHNAYDEADDLTHNEQGYIQEFVFRYLDEYFDAIAGEIRYGN